MKKPILMGVICLFAASCAQPKINQCSNQIPVLKPVEKENVGPMAHKDTSEMDCEIYTSINNYLKENLKDYNSYQPVSFDDFSPIMPESAKDITKYLSSIGYYEGKNRTPQNDSLADAWYKFKPLGFTIKHKYRAKNGFGAYGLATEEFTLDTAFKVKYAKESQYDDDKFKSIIKRADEMGLKP